MIIWSCRRWWWWYPPPSYSTCWQWWWWWKHHVRSLEYLCNIAWYNSTESQDFVHWNISERKLLTNAAIYPHKSTLRNLFQVAAIHSSIIHPWPLNATFEFEEIHRALLDTKTVTMTMNSTYHQRTTKSLNCDPRVILHSCDSSFGQKVDVSVQRRNTLLSRASHLRSLEAIWWQFRCRSWKQVQHLSTLSEKEKNYPEELAENQSCSTMFQFRCIPM